MAGLADLRAKYPEYNDLSDQQLADGFYKKYYSDMPRAQFDQKMGLAMSPAERFDEAAPGAADPNAPRPGLQAATSAAADTEGQRQYARDWSFPLLGLQTKPTEFEKSLGTGIVRLPARMIGAYKDITETAGAAAGGIAGWLGASDETAKGIHDTVTGTAAAVPGLGSLPSSEEVLDVAGKANEAVSKATGVDLSIHQPQGAAGAAGELVGGLLGGPKLAAPAAERAAVAATAPVAEVAAPAATKAAPTLPEMKGATDAAYTVARDAGLTVKARPFSRVIDQTLDAVNEAGFDDIARASKGFKGSKHITKFLDKMRQRGTDLTGETADRIRQEFGEAFKLARNENDRRILTIAKNKFDEAANAMTPGVDYSASNMAPEDAMKLWTEARATKTAEETAKSVEKAFGGKTSAQIQKQAQKWLDDPRKMARLGSEEQDLLRQMARTSQPEALAKLIGNVVPGGPLGSFISGTVAGPAGTAASVAVTATKKISEFQRGKRAEVLREIVRGYGPEPKPAVVDAAPLAIPEPAALPPPELPPATSPPVPWLALGAGNRPEQQPPP